MSKINYSWGPVEQYLDVELKNGSVNRERKHITLREFRNLIQSGYSLNGIAKTGVSKHITQFFSNLSQGKIVLNKEDQSYAITLHSSITPIIEGSTLETISEFYDKLDSLLD